MPLYLLAPRPLSAKQATAAIQTDSGWPRRAPSKNPGSERTPDFSRSRPESRLNDLLDDLGHHPGADGTTALPDGEAQTLFHRDRGDELDGDADVVAGHDHFLVLGQFHRTGDVGGAEVELGTVVVEEGGVTAAFVFAEHVDLGGEVGVGLDAAGFAQHLAALDVFALGAAQQDADVVTGLALVEEFAEHFDAGAGGFLRGANADDFDFFTDFDDAALDPAGHDGAAPGDGEHVFDGHEEGTVHSALGRGDVAVEGVGEVEDGFLAEFAFVAFEGEFGGAFDDGGVVAGEVVLGQQFAHFHLDEFEQLGVVDHVAFVEEHDDVGHADLAGEQDVLAGLGHGAISGGDDEDGAVHLGGTGDHVLDVVGVAGAVDVGVVAVGRLVFHVRGVDGDAASLLFGRCVDLVVGLGRSAKLGRQHGGDGRRQRGLAVVHVTNRAHVDVRLGPLKLFLRHDSNSSSLQRWTNR